MDLVHMIKPFHLSFAVPDLKRAVDFYINVLGSKLGRDSGSWVDIIFFGHQLTLHQALDAASPKLIDHFGPVLSKTEWLDVSKKISSNGIAFIVPPTVHSEGSHLESGKYIVRDPAGNTLEFKYYVNFSTQVEQKNA